MLLHVLRNRLPTREDHMQVPGLAVALAEACVRYARHSYTLLSNSWIDGSLVALDYSDTQYLFSTATVLAISVLWNKNTSSLDKDRFDRLASFLQHLRDNGNFPAAEFMKHLTATKPLVDSMLQQSVDTDLSLAAHGPEAQIAQNPPMPNHTNNLLSSGDMLLDPIFQDLCAQPVADLSFIEEAMMFNENDALYWPLANGEIALEEP